MKKYLILLLLPFLTTCSGGKQTIRSSDKEKLFIFYNNDNFSYLEPCGCRISPIGGMDRRWNAMVPIALEQRIFLDAGNFLFKSNSAAEYLMPQWYEQARGVVEAYNILHADVVTVGETDFALGIEKFLQLKKEAKFEYISSNIYHVETNKLFLKEFSILERGGKRIGIFAIFHPSLKLPDGLEARDPIGRAKETVKKLQDEKVDMIIALSHQGYDHDRAMAVEVPEINLIIGASSQSLLQTPDEVGKTKIVQLSSQGQMLGRLEYGLGKEITFKDSIVAELNADFNANPAKIANPMKNLVAVTNLRMQEANRKVDEELWSKHNVSTEKQFQTFISCRDCHSKQAEFQEKTLHSAAYLTLLAKKQESNLDCIKCHSVGFGEAGGFKNTKTAFLKEDGTPVSLQEIQKQGGWKYEDLEQKDYRKKPAEIRPDVARWIASLKKAQVAKAFVGVQCENCHTQMGEHPFGVDNKKGAQVAASLCLQCHTQSQMPSWYNKDGSLNKAAQEKDLVRVSCPR